MTLPAGDDPAPRSTALTLASRLLPGLVLVSLLSLAAIGLATLVPLPTVLIGLVLGVMSSGSNSPLFAPGLAFGGRSILRLGVALLGAQITLTQIVGLGPMPLVIALASLAVTLALGYLIARWLGLEQAIAILSAVAVAICGASAALAVAAVIPRERLSAHIVAMTVGLITLLGSLGMIAYPLAGEAIGLDAERLGIVLGASLHEVVQAVGAGFAHSEVAGEVAATVKLVRVACLAPVVVAIAWWVRRSADIQTASLPPILPAFLLGFVAFACLASTGAIPPAVGAALRDLSRFCLLVGIVALGMKIAPRQIIAVDRGLALAVTAQTLVIAAVAFGATWLLAFGQ